MRSFLAGSGLACVLGFSAAAALLLPTACEPSGPARKATGKHKAPESSAAPKPQTSAFGLTEVLDFSQTSVSRLGFSPATRNLFVSFGDDDKLYQWDLNTNTLAHTYRLGEGYRCDSVALSPDGRYLGVGCWPLDAGTRRCKTLILDTQAKRIHKDLGIDSRTYRPQFLPDGKTFAVDDGRLFDLDTRPVAGPLPPRPKPAPGSVWRIESSKETIETHGLYYRDAWGKDHRLTDTEWGDNYGITRDGKYVAATTWDGEVIVWRTKDRKEVFRKRIAVQYGHLAYDPGANRFLLADATHANTHLLALYVPEGDAAAAPGPADSTREADFWAACKSACYQLTAVARLGGQRVEFLEGNVPKDPIIPLLMVAREEDGQFIDFATSQINTTARPFCRSDRYVALATYSTGAPDGFLIYDSHARRFLARKLTDHVHDGCVIVGDSLFFSSCKTPQPILRLDILTGGAKAFGSPAAQGAAFHVIGPRVYTTGDDGKAYSIDPDRLTPAPVDLKNQPPTKMNYPTLRPGA
ncbi:MAG: WD40 repeat domain-containing protein [Planctomycetota bacterium]|nr:WD40 repeat domain-containing protein [Planctomycetota bacterium]